LSDLTKIEILLSDLEILESLTKNLIADHHRAVEEKTALESSLTKILEENKNLRKRVGELERDYDSLKTGTYAANLSLFDQMSDHEKDILVHKINDLILKINKHLIKL
jgi:phage shock protein A